MRADITVVVSTTPVSPTVASVLPAEAKKGESVRIYGTGFGASQGTSTVTLGGATAAMIQSWSDTEIKATVSASAVTGDVTVNVGGVVSNAGHLTVLWGNSSPANVVVDNDAATQNAPVMVSDGQGGAIVVWVDYRNGNADLYAQRLDASGQRLWASAGVPVSVAAYSQLAPQLVPDAGGGAVIAWEDSRDGSHYNIYAQRLDKDGNAAWTANGVPVATMAADQTVPRLIGDGAGGALIVWQDYRSGTDFDVYAQRLDGNGVPQWAATGLPVASATDNQFNEQIVSDGAGGAIVAWEDRRNGTDFDIYAQRIDSSGAPQWTVDGVAIVNAAKDQTVPELAPDGAGGAVVVWQDYRSGSSLDVFGQNVTGTGTMGWTANGVVISSASGNQVSPQIAASGQNKFLVAWEDYRNGNADVYAQQIDNLGAVQWSADGLPVTKAAGDQKLPQLVEDGADGAIVVWEDHRKSGNADIYAQRIGPSGAGYWTADGVAVSAARQDQLAPAILSDGNGGAIMVWEDHRNANADIFAQGISAGGNQ